jgi:hypothetical protein
MSGKIRSAAIPPAGQPFDLVLKGFLNVIEAKRDQSLDRLRLGVDPHLEEVVQFCPHDRLDRFPDPNCRLHEAAPFMCGMGDVAAFPTSLHQESLRHFSTEPGIPLPSWRDPGSTFLESVVEPLQRFRNDFVHPCILDPTSSILLGEEAKVVM